MVLWVNRSIPHGDPLSYFSFQPLLHNWCNEGHGMVQKQDPLLLLEKVVHVALSHCLSGPLTYA